MNHSTCPRLHNHHAFVSQVLGRVVKLHGVLPTPTTLVDMGRLANLELQAEAARAKAIASKGSR